jgi:hypothetical protein
LPDLCLEVVVTSDLTSTNTQLFRTTDAADPTALKKLSSERSALVEELTGRRRSGHRALDNDLAGEKTTRLPGPVQAAHPCDLQLPLPHRAPQAALAGAHAVTLTPRWTQLGRLLTALRKAWSR